jgi:hypothetical protein
MQLPPHIFFESLRRFVLIDLVDQIFKSRIKVILLFRQKRIKQIDDSCVVVCFRFQLIKYLAPFTKPAYAK